MVLNFPLEVSYFVNNSCNLNCKHCYVGYENKENELSIEQWKKTFENLIGLGALTFGNVGKEPLLSFDKTLSILDYLFKKRLENPKIRFGLVTNGTLLDKDKIKELEKRKPDYLDISIDGIEEDHDFIRGKGNYQKTLKNLKLMKTISPSLFEKVFVSFTLMNHNKNKLNQMVQELSKQDLKKFLMSPYVDSKHNNLLTISDKDVAQIYLGIIQGKIIDFSKISSVQILLKSDYDSQKDLISLLVHKEVIDTDNLMIDEYGVIFNLHKKPKGSKVIINYMPVSETFSKAIRISHDGYVSGCLEMFHKDYPKRAKTQIRNKDWTDSLKS